MFVPAFRALLTIKVIFCLAAEPLVGKDGDGGSLIRKHNFSGSFVSDSLTKSSNNLVDAASEVSPVLVRSATKTKHREINSDGDIQISSDRGDEESSSLLEESSSSLMEEGLVLSALSARLKHAISREEAAKIGVDIAISMWEKMFDGMRAVEVSAKGVPADVELKSCPGKWTCKCVTMESPAPTATPTETAPPPVTESPTFEPTSAPARTDSPTDSPTHSPSVSPTASATEAQDNNYCLTQASSAWRGFTCAASVQYCDSWAKDMQRCCPASCGKVTLTEAECLSSKSSGTCVYPIPAKTDSPTLPPSQTPAPTPRGPGGQGEFTRAIYLYWSDSHRDFLTVTRAAKIALGIAGDYTLKQSEPIGFISPGKTVLADKALYLHYSPKRKDFVASVDGPEKNNGYTNVATLGYIASKYPLGTYEMSELNKFWSSSNADIGVVPFASNKDFNMLVTGGAGFRNRGGTIGYMAVGTCKLCNIVMSPTYRSTARLGCPQTCKRGTETGTAVWKFKSGDFLPMAGKQKMANGIIKSFQRAGDGASPHMTFAYYCCLSRKDLCKIKKVIDKFDWTTPTELSYDRVVGNVDRPGRASMVINVDRPTQQRFLDLWDKVDEKIKEAGVKNAFPRAKQYIYHNTLQQVDYTDYPIAHAVKDINEKITHWTQPIMVAEKPETLFCRSRWR